MNVHIVLCVEFFIANIARKWPIARMNSLVTFQAHSVEQRDVYGLNLRNPKIVRKVIYEFAGLLGAVAFATYLARHFGCFVRKNVQRKIGFGSESFATHVTRFGGNFAVRLQMHPKVLKLFATQMTEATVRFRYL